MAFPSSLPASLLNLPPRPTSLSRSSSSSSVTLVDHEAAHDFHFDQTSSYGALPKSPDIGSVHHSPPRQCLDLPIQPITHAFSTALYSYMNPLAGTTPVPRPLRIVGLLATPDTGCEIYARITAKHCRANGVEYEKRDLTLASGSMPTPITSADDHDPRDPNLLRHGCEKGVGFDEVQRAIESINKEEGVDGLIVYFPLFGPELDAKLRSLISPRIDVEGLSPLLLAKSYAAAPSRVDDVCGAIYPCTPLAVVRCLQSLPMWDWTDYPHCGLKGRVITVVNRSETVGRPLAAMLANAGAIVYSVDVNSTDVYLPASVTGTETGHKSVPCTAPLAALTSISDVILSAVPSRSFKISTSSIRPGAVCVNIATGNNFDDDVRDRAGVWVGRIGEVTRWVLLMNALTLRMQGEDVRSDV